MEASKMNKHYSKQFKTEIVGKYLDGQSISDISVETGVSRSTLYSWIESEKNHFTSKANLNLRDYHFLKSKCDRQEKIIEILKKSPCSVSAPLRNRYEAIKALKSDYSESLLCDALNVSKGSYYNHIFRNKGETNMFVEKEEKLTPIIEEIYTNSKYLYGPGKVHAVMKERGYDVSLRFVARIMHNNNWFAVRTSSKTLYEMNCRRKQNVLNQDFNVTFPNIVWVSDVTFFRFKGKTLYICAIMDLFSRKIISFKISNKNSTQITKSTFIKAFEERTPDTSKLLFHSDNGVNYTSKTFMKYLADLGVKQSFSRPGIPYDNSVIESFFKTLKAEELYIGRYKSINDFKTSIAKYIEFYNNERPHSTIRYKSPSQYEIDYWIKVNKTK